MTRIIRRCIAIIVTLVYVWVCSSCSYVAYKDYFSDVEDYAEIWDLTGYRYDFDEVSPLFPVSVDRLDVTDFLCRYDQQLPLGEGIQIYLEICYEDENVFTAEYNRIASITFKCDGYFLEDEFIYYATMLGEDSVSEYAVIAKDKMVIRYVYLQDVPVNGIQIDKRFIPVGYTGYGEIDKKID